MAVMGCSGSRWVLFKCDDEPMKTVSALDVRRGLRDRYPARVVEHQLAALADARRLVADAPPAPAGWSVTRFVRSDRHRDD
jgi:hypothetical protein